MIDLEHIRDVLSHCDISGRDLSLTVAEQREMMAEIEQLRARLAPQWRPASEAETGAIVWGRAGDRMCRGYAADDEGPCNTRWLNTLDGDGMYFAYWLPADALPALNAALAAYEAFDAPPTK